MLKEFFCASNTDNKYQLCTAWGGKHTHAHTHAHKHLIFKHIHSLCVLVVRLHRFVPLL